MMKKIGLFICLFAISSLVVTTRDVAGSDSSVERPTVWDYIVGLFEEEDYSHCDEKYKNYENERWYFPKCVDRLLCYGSSEKRAERECDLVTYYERLTPEEKAECDRPGRDTTISSFGTCMMECACVGETTRCTRRCSREWL